MEKNNSENLDSLNEDTDQAEDLENDLEDAEGDSPEMAALKEKNRQLFERAKKAEGFEKNADGKWVKKAKPAAPATPTKPQPAESGQAPDLDKLLDEKLEKRELDSLDISDELKQEVQAYARLKGMTVKKALESDYVKFQISRQEKIERADKASIGGTRKATTKKDYSEVNPTTDFDLKTPEGRAELAKWEDEMRKKLG